MSISLKSCTALCLMFAAAHPVSAQRPIDFAHDVVPVLKKHCLECHGGREAKGSFSMNHRELLVASGHVVPGKPGESQLLQLVVSGDKDKQMPPADRVRVSAEEQAILRRWIEEELPWDDDISFATTAWEPPLKPRRPELPDAIDGRTNPIDRILDHALAQQATPRPAPVSDAVFLRRACLDLTGVLPEPEKLESFLADSAPDKRDRVIRELLDDDLAWADHWLTFFNDLLRNDYSGTGFITGGRKQVSAWLYHALVTNMPFDQFTRELIAPPTPDSQGYIDGIRWRGEVSAGQTVEIQFAQSISQSFLGINLKCASCHDSFIDRWKLDEAYGLAAIYSPQPLQISRCDKPLGKQAAPHWLFPELGEVDPAAPREERLRQLAVLMTHPENGRFTRTIVNRLWYKLMGRGIVHPLDAMQTEPWNEDLLDFLAVYLTDHNYDLKSVVHLIAASQAWQSESAPRDTDSGDTKDGRFVFRGPVSRRMTAEQFLDGVWQITGAAPANIDAPVFRGVVQPGQAGEVQLQGRWIWGDSAADGKVPAAGEKISLRKQFVLSDDVTQGGAVITCDNSYVLFINGREVQRGSDWQQPQGVALKGLLKKGENTIVVMAENAGSGPNSAGLFFEARFQLISGEQQSLCSDGSWQWNPETAATREGRSGRIDGDWKPAVLVPPLDVWTAAVESKGKHLLLQSVSGELRMTRASLLKNDFLMKSLGRPLREQIVSMRPAELTTLEAIDLSNGSALAGYLQQGGKMLASRWQDHPEDLIRYLYQFAFSRVPTEDERAVLLAALGDHPGSAEVEDVLWAVFMTPEFLLVR